MSTNSGDPGETSRSVASVLGLHCFPMSLLSGRYELVGKLHLFRKMPHQQLLISIRPKKKKIPVTPLTL